MPTIEHSVLSGSELHEPKGISSASDGQIYVANGAGSGEWKYEPTGWGYYQDNGADQIIGTSPVRLSIDGGGPLTNTAYLPTVIRGTGNLWDTTADAITPVSLGDGYTMRLDLPITAKSGTPTELTIQFDISGAATPTTVILSRYFGLSKTPPYTLTFSMPLVVLTEIVVTNGIQLFCNVDSGSVTVAKPSITLLRLHSGDL